MGRDDLLDYRTGLPGPLAEGYSGSESEEEDEADEDSNGASHTLWKATTSDQRAARIAQRRSTTKMIILMRRVRTMTDLKGVTVRLLPYLAPLFLRKQLCVPIDAIYDDSDG